MIASIFFTRVPLMKAAANANAQSRPHLEGSSALEMKAIILSAGQGSRLGHLVDDRPKCLIDFNGRTLLDRQLDTLESERRSRGGRRHRLPRRAGQPGDRSAERRPERPDDLQPVLQGRRQYRLAVHGARGAEPVIASCGTATRWFRTTLMARVVANRQPGICVTIDRKDSYDEDDMKVVARGRAAQSIGKRDLGRVNAESIGLLAFRSGGAEQFREAIERAMRTPEGTTIWYLRVIHQIAQICRCLDARHPGPGMGRGRLSRRRRDGERADGSLGLRRQRRRPPAMDELKIGTVGDERVSAF